MIHGTRLWNTTQTFTELAYRALASAHETDLLIELHRIGEGEINHSVADVIIAIGADIDLNIVDALLIEEMHDKANLLEQIEEAGLADTPLYQHLVSFNPTY
jgi:hypothetical protein